MKKTDKKVLKTVAAKDAVFAYISVCCNVVAEKPACAVVKGHRTGLHPGDRPEGEATLGGWRCGLCRKPCKVSRMKNPLREESHA